MMILHWNADSIASSDCSSNGHLDLTLFAVSKSYAWCIDSISVVCTYFLICCRG